MPVELSHVSSAFLTTNVGCSERGFNDDLYGYQVRRFGDDDIVG